MMRLRTLAATLFLALLLPLIAACGAGNTQTSPTTAAPAGGEATAAPAGGEATAAPAGGEATAGTAPTEAPAAAPAIPPVA